LKRILQTSLFWSFTAFVFITANRLVAEKRVLLQVLYLLKGCIDKRPQTAVDAYQWQHSIFLTSIGNFPATSLFQGKICTHSAVGRYSLLSRLL
jgi:hypothetical protein